MKALFVNVDSTKESIGGLSSVDTGAQCSVYENGLTFYNALQQSQLFDVEYCEAHLVDSFDLPSYDLGIFTHMTWRLQVPRHIYWQFKSTMAIVMEASKDILGAHCEYGLIGEFYTYVASPDPTAVTDLPKVLALPRIAWRANIEPRAARLDHPIISTYGLPDGSKDLISIVRAVEAEFDEATIRFKFARASFQPDNWFNTAQAMIDEIRGTTPSRIKIEVITDYLSRKDLVAWLAESDLNVFISYPYRDAATRGAVAASPDQAVAAQRPIAVSDTAEFRHIHEYQKSWPEASFKELMSDPEPVLKMYEAWSPSNFVGAFDEFMKKVL